MQDFESYAARERLASIRANAARKLTRQQRANRRRIYRRTSAVLALLALYALCFFLGASLPVKAAENPAEAQESAPMETPAEPAGSAHAGVFDEPEGFENEAIESAMLLRSTAIENCTVMVDLGDGYGLRTLVANDTGVKGNHIDICVPTHDEALRLGVQTSTVYWCEEF